MKKKFKLYYILSGLIFLLFVLFTVMVKGVDVRPLGPNKSRIGFSTINTAIFSKLGESNLFYTITEVLGYIAIAVALGFALIGVLQLVKRKGIEKVDPSILALGAFYVLMFAFYAFFEVLIINYRPVLIDGALEASYPSSHTMLVLCIMSTAMMQFHERIRTKSTLVIADVASVLIIAVTVVGRLLSGVHWFTDIIGSILISTALILLYYATAQYLQYLKRKEERRPKGRVKYPTY